MTPRTRALAPALALALLAEAGCTPNRPDLRKGAAELLGGAGLGTGTPGAGGELGGRLIAPRRCALRVAIVTRPFQDALINDELWALADEQAVDPDARRTLEANNLRAGVIAGELPAKLVGLFDEQAPLTEKVIPTQVDLPDGDHTLVPLAPQVAEASILLNRDGRAVGKEFRDAQGFLRVVATREGDSAVRLRFTPQLHHGPVRHGYAAAPGVGVGPFATQQFIVKDGQQEEMLREMAAGLVVRPGQVAVLGARPDRPRSLGDFLFTHQESNGDRLVQKVVLVWAEPSRMGTGPAPGGRGVPEAPIPPALEAVEPPAMPEDPPRDGGRR